MHNQGLRLLTGVPAKCFVFCELFGFLAELKGMGPKHPAWDLPGDDKSERAMCARPVCVAKYIKYRAVAAP